MSDYNDIEQYRRKRRRKRWIKRIILFFIVAVVLAGGLIAFSYFNDFDPFGFSQTGDEEGSTGFPIALAGDTAETLIPMGKDLVLLTDNKLRFYNSSGKQLGSADHGYSNPTVKAAEKKVLLYDRGGTEFRIENKRGTLQKKSLADKIVFAEISSEGYVAVVTQAARYASALHIYNPSMEETFTWHSENQIVALDFKNGSKGCVAVTVSAQNGEIASTLVGLNFSKEKEEFSTQAVGLLGLSVDVKSSGQIVLMGDSAVVIFESGGKKQAEYSYQKKLVSFANTLNEEVVLVLSDSNTNAEHTVTVLDLKGQVKASKTMELPVEDLKAQGNLIALLSGETVYQFDRNLTSAGQIVCGPDPQTIAVADGKVYLKGIKEIRRLEQESPESQEG